MGIQPGARFHARIADALPATLYVHFTQAIYRNKPIVRWGESQPLFLSKETLDLRNSVRHCVPGGLRGKQINTCRALARGRRRAVGGNGRPR